MIRVHKQRSLPVLIAVVLITRVLPHWSATSLLSFAATSNGTIFITENLFVNIGDLALIFPQVMMKTETDSKSVRSLKLMLIVLSIYSKTTLVFQWMMLFDRKILIVLV